MPFNGSGAYSLPAGNPVVSGTTISSTVQNSTLSDLASALSTVICKDGQSVPSANLPMGGFKLTGLAAGSTNGDSVRYEQLTAVQASITSAMPAGTLIDFAGVGAPAGFLVCDGSAISRTTYATLFSAIGTTWGVGDGSTTFTLPSLSRRVTVGSGGAGTGTLANTVGATGGEETHVLTTAELAVHNHGVTDPTHAHGTTESAHSHNWGHNNQLGAGAGAGNYGGTSGGYAEATSTATTGLTVNAASTGVTVNNAGSGSAHNNIQPSAVVLKCIKF